MRTRHLFIALSLATAGTLPAFAYGPLIMVHGHADDPSLWTIQGSALVNSSGNTRFYDPKYYYSNELPAQFKTNGIYGVTYYSKNSANELEPTVICPVLAGTTELAPDDTSLRSFLYGQTDSYATRLASIINRAYADTGQKVTLVCHSMGGLVALSSVTYFGVQNKVERIITIGTPLRGFPADARVPADIIGLGRTNLFREGLQMSEGVKYAGQSFSEILESRFKLVRPAGLALVNVVGTFSPFPDDFLTGPSDGVVRAVDQRFRDSSLAPVYELPLVHIKNFRVAQYPDDQVECFSSRTTQILEKEALGLNPPPRLGTALTFNYGTGRIRVTVQNNGGLPVTFSSVSAQFEFLGPQGRVGTDSLGGLANQTLAPGQFQTVDGLALERGEKADVRLTLMVNGQELRYTNTTYIVNIQAPEIEASFRYDLLNSILHNEWNVQGGTNLQAVAWNVKYRLEGNTYYDADSNRLTGNLRAYYHSGLTGLVSVASSNVFFSESFAFSLDPVTKIFDETSGTILGKTPLLMDDAVGSRLRSLYRAKLLSLVNNPGPFKIEGTFSALAGIRLDRPVFLQDRETQGLELDLNGALVFAFHETDGDHLITLPFQASCGTTFVNDRRGLVLQPRVRSLSLSGFSLNENFRTQINNTIQAREFILLPASSTDSLNELMRSALVQTFGAKAVRADFKLFDTATIAIDPSTNRLRFLFDFYENPTAYILGQKITIPDRNVYPGVPENGLAVQERFFNRLLDRTIPVVNASLRETGAGKIPLGVEIPLGAGTAPVGMVAAGLQLAYYFGSVQLLAGEERGIDEAYLRSLIINMSDNPGLGFYIALIQTALSILDVLDDPDGRQFQFRFAGPDNKINLNLPVDAVFSDKLRAYVVLRIGFDVPFVGWVGYEKREEVGSAGINELLAVDLDANIYPYVRETSAASQQTPVGVVFKPDELDVNVRFSASRGMVVPFAGELLVAPLLHLARYNADWVPALATVAETALGSLASGAIGSAVLNDQAIKQLGTNGNPALRMTDLTDGSGRFVMNSQPGELPSFVFGILAFGHAITNWENIREAAHDVLEPMNKESTVRLPAGLLLKNLTVASGAASFALDLDPNYGDLYVTKIIGLDATNGIVSLTRDDFAFDAADAGPTTLTYVGDGESTRFSSLWIKKNVRKVRLNCRYDAMYVSRYNNATYPGYSLKYKQVGGANFAVPADYAYNSQADTASFSVDIPLLEGVSDIHAFSLQLPKFATNTCLSFLVGKDTAPILINGPYAAYSGVTSNVTIAAGTRVYLIDGATKPPSFVLDDLKLLNLSGEVSVTDLKALAAASRHTMPPANQVYGVDYSWTGRLSPAQFPEGLYAVLVTIREQTLNKRGTLLIPLMVDRTPPELEVKSVSMEPPVVSPQLSLPLTWSLSDHYSAVMNNVYLTYQALGGSVTTGTVFVAGTKALAGGERRLDFAPDFSSVPLGTEQVYTLQIHASDVPGNRGVSSNFTFLVDTKPPTIDSLFVYPSMTGGAYNSILNRSNHTLTTRVVCSEPFTGRFMLVDANNTTNLWFATSTTNSADPSKHQAVWVLDLPPADPKQGMLNGVVADGVHRLSIQLVDRARNTNTYMNVKTIMVDREPPVVAFRSQPAFIPANRTVYPLDVDTNGFTADDQITSIALANLNYFAPTSAVPYHTITSWTGSQISGVMASGIPLAGQPAGYYGVEIKARDSAGNETRVATQFGYQFMLPHVEAVGAPNLAGIVPIVGIAVDPYPADRFPFRSRELYWTLGSNVAAPTNLAAINPGIWKTAGFYVLPPRGTAFAAQDNASGEMVASGTLGYWNSTSAGLAFQGDAQTTIPGAGIVDSDVTLLLVVRDQGGQTWAHAATVHVDNRQTDTTALTIPGVQVAGASVTGQQLQLDTALLRDTPSLQMVVMDATGNAVYRTTRANVESKNKLFGRPTYSLEKDFGYFAWYDQAAGQLRVRCVSPERDSQGGSLSKGHTFYFSLLGSFGTNDLAYYQLSSSEVPTGADIFANTNGYCRAAFALYVPPGAEKGVSVAYHGGSIMFNPSGIDEYVQVVYEPGPGQPVDRRFWRTDDTAAVFPNYLSMSTVRNLVGLDGTVMNGISPEQRDLRAIANHSGLLNHVFLGQSRNEPLSPMGITLDSAVVQPDLSLNWDLRLANGNYAAPGTYRVYLYTIDPQAGRFHGAVGTFTLSPQNVPFSVTGLRLSSTNFVNPANNGGIVLDFNATRSANTTVQILDAANHVVATIASSQFLEGRTDTNAPIQVWWDGYTNGVPAAAGNYRFRLTFGTDGVTTNFDSAFFTLSYPTNSPRESNWGLLTQPIAFDPDTRDRIMHNPDLAWVTLHFDAGLADGTTNDAEMQVALERPNVGAGFESVENTNTHQHIAVSPLFGDAVQRFDRIRVKFNDRVVDVFPPIDLSTATTNADIASRAGLFNFQIKDKGARSFRLQAILRAQLKPWMAGLNPVLDGFNHVFDPAQVREFTTELDFREKAGTDGVLQSLPWDLDFAELLWGYTTNGVALFGGSVLDNLLEIEIRDRNGLQTLARFNSWQIKPGGISAVEQIFTLTGFTNRATNNAVGLDFVFEARLNNLQTKATSLGVPVSFGYADIDGWLEIPTTATLADDLDPFPTRLYHSGGYANVKAYSGDSALIQEVGFYSNSIAGHIPFQYSIRPFNDGAKGQQVMQAHPYLPYFFRKEANTNSWSSYLDHGFMSMVADLNKDGFSDLILNGYNDGVNNRIYPALEVYMGSANGLSNTPAWYSHGDGFNDIGNLTGVGDFNGDGFGDVMLSYYNFSDIYLGSAGGMSNAPAWSIPGPATSVGDINGDHYDDVVVSVQGSNSISGFLFYLGSPSGLSNAPIWTITPHFDEILGEVIRAGDVNGDGFGDVLIRNSVYNDATLQYDDVYYIRFGGSGGWSKEVPWPVSAVTSFSVGDVNGDGYADAAVVLNYNGTAAVFLGSPAGLSATNAWIVTNTSSMWLGSSVTIGDLNGDGYGDVVVGAMGGFEYFDNYALVYLGSATGPKTDPDWTFNMGRGLLATGDFNGDGYDDITGCYMSPASSSQGSPTVRYSPLETVFHKGWVRGGAGGAANLGHLPITGVTNMLPVPYVNQVSGSSNRFEVSLFYDPVAKQQQVVLTNSAGQSGFYTNAPFPINAGSAAQWISANFVSGSNMPAADSFFAADGRTNSAYANYLLNLKFGVVTNDLLIAATPDAYDVVVTYGLVDYKFVATQDPQYNPTINYFSEKSAWELILPKLPVNGLPGVDTTMERRPRLNLTNAILHYDPNFPHVAPADLHLAYSDPSPEASGWAAAHIQSSFSHETSRFYRPWSLTNDPNVQALAMVQAETNRVTFLLDSYVYEAQQSVITNIIVQVQRPLIASIPLTLVGNSLASLNTSATNNDSDKFKRFLSADITIQIIRTSAYAAEETETLRLQKIDLAGSNRAYSVRSARYRCEVTPVISAGPLSKTNNTLSFVLGVKLDPPVEYSTRKPLRLNDRISLPLHVIDREKFWQVDSGEYAANLFQEVAVQGQSLPSPSKAGYVIDSFSGYTSTNGRPLLAMDPDYSNKAGALFWNTERNRFVKNPRIILGGMDVVLKDLSGVEEAPGFQEKRYVAVTNKGDYFNDLYLAGKDLDTLSWKAKIRPQAKEHAYVKVYGSVGGQWSLSHRKKEGGQLSGVLPQDAESMNWTLIATNSGRGQNQFLCYWDITELNGPHILRLESTDSPDNAYQKPEVKHLDVMLGQHLPGANNPIFSPNGPEKVSLFSMHGRTQLTSAPEDRQADDLFFTVNPMKIEERPFSLGTNGTIPLGERVQILPHTESNPFSVNFYIDQEEYHLYDQFRLYHQLEGGPLAEITSLPPSLRPKYTLIQGYVAHTSIVGFLPNPSLRLCTLDVPGSSPDGIIRIAGAVDLYGTDNQGNKNEDLTVAIVVSTNIFYTGQVKARLTTGAKAEFPIPAEAAMTDALLRTSWAPGQLPQTYHVFAVVVDSNDNWLTLNRQLTPADEGKHLFNVTAATVTMTTNLNNSLTVVGRPVFSPNNDGLFDTLPFRLDFGRAGLVQMEFQNSLGQVVHRQSVSLESNGQAGFTWDGYITGQGLLQVAPDGFYTVKASYANGQDLTASASQVVEVRASSRYSGLLQSEGIEDIAGFWRTLWTHVTGPSGFFYSDLARIQYSDSSTFTTVRGDRSVDQAELSAYFDDALTNLTAFLPDTNGNLTLYYRLQVNDEVANVGYSPVVSVSLPQTGRLNVASVTPPAGATNISTEPAISIVLSNASPFSPSDLANMIHLNPSANIVLGLSPDRRTISVASATPFAPGAQVGVSVQCYPQAPMPGPDTYAWSFSVMPSNRVDRTLQARVIGVPGTLTGIGAQGTGFVVVTNKGNVPARLTLVPGGSSQSVLQVTATNAPVIALPLTEIAIPVTVAVTGQYSGTVSTPLTAVEQSLGVWTNLLMNVSVSSVTSAPTVLVFSSTVATNAFMVRFSGQSAGSSTISTLARLNGGSWWVVAQTAAWNFEGTFSADGDVLEIVSMGSDNRSSATYAYTFAGPPFVLALTSDFSLAWDAQLGRIYTIEWSTNLLQWTYLTGTISQSGSEVTVGPGYNPVQILDTPSGRLTVKLTSTHPVVQGGKAFFRVRSSTDYPGDLIASPNPIPSPLVLLINKDQGLSWEARLNQVYKVESSSDLQHWTEVSGTASQIGSAITIAPGGAPVYISNAPLGRISVSFATNHPVLSGPKAFFRVKAAP